MKVTNFRKYKESPWIDLKDINCFVGTNGSGKSTMVKAYLLVYKYLELNKLYEINFSDPIFDDLNISDFTKEFNINNTNDIIKFQTKFDEFDVDLHLTKHQNRNYALVKYLQINFHKEHIKYIFEQEIDDISNINRIRYNRKVKIKLYNTTLYKDQVISIIKNNSEFNINLLKYIEDLETFEDFTYDFEVLIQNDTEDEFSLFSIENNIISLYSEILENFIQSNLRVSYFSPPIKYPLSPEFIISQYRISLLRHGRCLNIFLNKFKFDYYPLIFRKYPTLQNIKDNTNDLAQIIYKYQISTGHQYIKSNDFILKWIGSEGFNIGENFFIENIGGNYLDISISNDKIPINQLGSGQIQLLKIIFRIALLIKDFRFTNYLILEEPEMNLHPSLQSKLADLFYDAYIYSNRKLNLIIETHSEYLIRRIQVLICENKLKDHPFSIHYFPSGKDEEPYPIHIDEKGIMDRDFGKGFFDEVSNHTLQLIKRQLMDQDEA